MSSTAWALAANLLWLAATCYWLRPLWRRQQTTGEHQTLVVWASQTGQAERLGRQALHALQAAGQPAAGLPLGRLTPAHLLACRQLWLVASTYGDGQAPDSAQAFEHRLMPQGPALPELSFALLGLGDSQYPHFCAFAKRLESWLRDKGAQPLQDSIYLDNQDPDGLVRWRASLAQHTGLHELPEDDEQPWQPVTLLSRRALNPGSPGLTAWHLSLQADALGRWQAGDLLELQHAGQRRLYSIANRGDSRQVELLVRHVMKDDGSQGLMSGWLCQQAATGSLVEARVHHNPSFALPDRRAPVILIGSGTGLAGLRALLQEQLQRGQPTLLLFGERSPEHDCWLANELDHLPAEQLLVQRCFSRAPTSAAAGYVQDLLREQPERLHDWIDRGASIRVCGSMAMGQAVDSVLQGLLGASAIKQMAADGRYRRDIY